MLISKKKAEEAKRQATKESQLNFADLIKSWHEEYSQNQAKLESEFDFDAIGTLSMNIWDDFDEAIGSTYAYVEMGEEVPDKFCFDIVLHLYQYMQPNYGNQISIRFYDSTTLYPENLLNNLGRRMSFKRWEILIKNTNYSDLEKMVKSIKSVPKFKGRTIEIYSES
ncbi:hypothetical protein [Vibrio sp. Hal054]|uniref:hypothetical protein n=1 Tax=Vibrio sp. Hal054 TaxID=3035158 RepID=UPI00301E1076